MRISDWSQDVGSTDLVARAQQVRQVADQAIRQAAIVWAAVAWADLQQASAVARLDRALRDQRARQIEVEVAGFHGGASYHPAARRPSGQAPGASPGQDRSR